MYTAKRAARISSGALDSESLNAAADPAKLVWIDAGSRNSRSVASMLRVASPNVGTSGAVDTPWDPGTIEDVHRYRRKQERAGQSSFRRSPRREFLMSHAAAILRLVPG